jgi:hypothetical protein
MYERAVREPNDLGCPTYGPIHTGPVIRARVFLFFGGPVRRKIWPVRQTPIVIRALFIFFTCHVLPNYTSKFFSLATPNLVFITAVFDIKTLFDFELTLQLDTFSHLPW